MFYLSEFFNEISNDGKFLQTQFANTTAKHSLCFVGKEKYLSQVNDNSNISCVITNAELGKKIDGQKGLVISNKPERDFYELHNILVKQYEVGPDIQYGISESAKIHPSAIVSKKTFIGDDVEIAAGAVILDGSVLDKNVFIGPNAIIGADGHFFKKYNDGIFKVSHAGGVYLHDNVQILAGAVISKALHTDFTEVGTQSVVSIKSHVGHGCKVGKKCIIAGNAQISGYTIIGDDVWIGPSATVGNLLTIGDRASIEVGSVVVENVLEGKRVSGNFAHNHKKNMMSYMRNKRLSQ